MNKKTKTILAFITILIFIFSISSNVIVKAVTIEGYRYSSKLVTGTELAWTLKKLEMTPESTGDPDLFQLTATVNMSEGDVFKIVLLQDLMNIGLDISELYGTSTQWGEFFHNGVSLGKNVTDIYWGTFMGETGMMSSAHILPTIIELDTGDKNYFDFMAEEFEALPDNETGGISISNTETKYTMKLEVHEKIVFLGTFKIDLNLEIVYNKEWGVLAKYDLTESVTALGETAKISILYEINNEEIQVAPFNWTFSFVAIFVTALVIMRRRKK